MSRNLPVPQRAAKPEKWPTKTDAGTARDAHVLNCVNTASSSTRATMGRVRYPATEKDCVTEDGGVAECQICMEDFEAGVAMARLECLCRFHERCIAEWWEKKPGNCPTHQLQQ
ncbi:hypothetical protein LTR28_005037 [Elasticomyces elasticus]|nr:hypothetical protein LTR28_005037 [Elasticomyces elasticus]